MPLRSASRANGDSISPARNISVPLRHTPSRTTRPPHRTCYLHCAQQTHHCTPNAAWHLAHRTIPHLNIPPTCRTRLDVDGATAPPAAQAARAFTCVHATWFGSNINAPRRVLVLSLWFWEVLCLSSVPHRLAGLSTAGRGYPRRCHLAAALLGDAAAGMNANLPVMLVHCPVPRTACAGRCGAYI